MGVCVLVSRKMSLIELVGLGDVNGARFAAKWNPGQIGRLGPFDVNVNALAGARDRVEFAPMHVACWRGDLEMMTMLLGFGADPNILGTGGMVPLHCAAVEGHASLVELLVRQGAYIDATDDDGNTALHLAAVRGRAEVVRKLLACGSSSVNTVNRAGYTPLHEAVLPVPRTGTGPSSWQNNHSQVLKYLLQAGADPNCYQRSSETTPLHLSASIGYLDGAKLLASWGADANRPDREGFTPLHLAVRHPEMVKALLSFGAKPDGVSSSPCTPLHKALLLHQSKAAAVLLEAGADPTVRADDGRSAYDLATGDDELEHILNVRRPLNGESKGGDTDTEGKQKEDSENRPSERNIPER